MKYLIALLLRVSYNLSRSFRLAHHVIDYRLDVRIGEARVSAFWRHRILALERTVVECFIARFDTRRPGRIIAQLGRARRPRGVAGCATGGINCLDFFRARRSWGRVRRSHRNVRWWRSYSPRFHIRLWRIARQRQFTHRLQTLRHGFVRKGGTILIRGTGSDSKLSYHEQNHDR